MFNRFCFGALLLVGLAGLLSGCSTTSSPDSLTTIVISPAGANAVTTELAPQGVAQGHAQFTAIGYYGHAGHQTTKDITQEVTWASSLTQVVGICTNGSPAPCTPAMDGLATVTGFGSNGIAWIGFSNITASAPGFNGDIVSNSATYTVTACTICAGANTDITSVAVIPATQTVATLNVPIQYEAIGTDASGGTHVLTNTPGIQWNSSNSSAASIVTNTGLATTAGAGTTTITAIFINKDGTAAEGSGLLTVAPTTVSGSTEPLTSMTVSPSAQTASSVGQSLQFLAIATTGTGSTVNLTDQGATINNQAIKAAVWTSSNQSVATIDPASGMAMTKGSGAAVITAVATNPDGTVVIGQSNLTVSGTTTTSSEPVASLAVLPATQTSLAVGQKINFLAIGTTGSGATVNLTSQPVTINGVTIQPALWSSSNPSVASVNPATGVATSVGAGTTAITAIVTNTDNTVVEASAVLTVTITTAEPYVSLAIVPAAQTLTAAGQVANYLAIGTTGTGATVDLTSSATWKSSNGAVATPVAANAGQFQAGSTNGVTAITATVANKDVGGASTDTTSVTASAALTVDISATPEPLLSMSIVPSSQSAAAGQQVLLLAIGNFSSSAPLSIGPGQQNMANANVVADGYTVTWYSSNQSVAVFCKTGLPAPSCTNVPDGLLVGVNTGTTAITAVASGNPDHSQVTATATFTVSGLSASTISALSIFPASQTITMPEAGQPNPTVNLVVIGTNGAGLQTNVTNQISWTSSNPAVVPTTNCAVAGSTPATGCNIVSGANSAVVTAIGQGTTTITASLTNGSGTGATVVTQTASLTVTAPAAEPLLSLAILPNAPSVLFPGSTQATQLTAIGTLATGATVNLTSQPFTVPGLQAPNNTIQAVAWTSGNSSIATVCSQTSIGTPAVCPSGPASLGLVTPVSKGTTAITATTTNPDGTFVYATVPFTVQDGSADQMSALTIIPSALSLSATGQPGSLIALATSTVTGLQQDVTASPQLAWSSSNQAIATVSSLPAGLPPVGNQTQTCALNNATPPVQVCALDLPGVVKGVSVGSTNITAEWTNTPAVGSTPAVVVTAQATVTVTNTPAAEPLLAITVLPATVSISALDGTAQFLAFGTFSTAPTSLDITNGFFHAGFSSPQYPSSACTDAFATADAAQVAADAAANLPVAVPYFPHPECTFVPVTWVSLPDPFVFPINSAGAAGAKGGLITATDNGTEEVYAVASNPDGTLVYSSPGPSGGSSATFSCPYVAPTYEVLSDGPPIIYDYNVVVNPGSCNGKTINNSLLSTLTVFDANLTSTGLNQGNWLITALSATSTPANPVTVIHCGPGSLTGGSVCEATYPNGTPVVLTAPAEPATATEPAVNFGGWSDNCTPCTLNPDLTCTPIATPPFYTALGPNSCQVVVGADCVYNPITATYVCSTSSNVSVGAIFN
jgi:uncharacterized protein YjdB